MAKKVIRRKRPLSETQAEFDQLQEEQRSAVSRATSKEKQLEEEQLATVRATVEGVSVESIVSSISTLGVQVNKSLNELSLKLVEEVQLLDQLRSAVEVERRELERLHKIDVVQVTIDQMLADYETRKQQLESEIETTRRSWNEERELFERSSKEFEENLRKTRLREKEEYEYSKLQERKKSEDKYAEEQRLLLRANKEKQESLEKSWAEREKFLKINEDEFSRLKKEVVGFEDRLKLEVSKAIEATKKEMEGQHSHQMLILRKEFEAEKKVSDLQIKTLTDTLERQFAQIEGLQKRLEEAKQQVQDIAVKAIEGASGSRALQHVNQIAMEQAKTRGPANS